MRTLITSFALLAASSAVLAQTQTVSFTPAADTSLFQASPSGQNVSNGGGGWLHVGLTNSWGERRPLLRFNLASIPANATITSASLQVTVDRESGGGAVPLRVRMVPVIAAWQPGTVNTGGAEGTGAPAQEGDATWRFRFYSATPANAIAWTSAGGDFGTSTLSTATMSATGNVSFASSAAFVALAQSWVSTPSSNFGIALLPQTDQTGVARRLRSAEATTGKPTLTISYTVQQSCDIDFNNDGLFPADEDLVEFFNVLAGGACSTQPPAGQGCDDIDINNDGLFPSDDDIVAFLRALAGGSC